MMSGKIVDISPFADIASQSDLDFTLYINAYIPSCLMHIFLCNINIIFPL